MKAIICFPLIISIFSFILSFNTSAYASSGYDNGSSAGKGALDLDFTLNPGDIIDNGQSYVVSGYGITKKIDFHGYLAHEAEGVKQVYYGLMYNFISNDILDASTALGLRHREDEAHVIFSQLLYTIKLPNDFDIIGNSVVVFNSDDNTGLGVTFDIAIRIPVPQKYTPSFLKQAKIVIGGSRNTGKKWFPTYNLDLKF